MIHALLHGKLSPEESRLEDILTSNVFGLLKYLPPRDALLPWLTLAIDSEGRPLIARLLPAAPIAITWKFWPMLKETGCAPCEPDLLLDLHADDSSLTRFLIEAKYSSGKSSEASSLNTPPNDQLAREFDNLYAGSARDCIARFALLYITADLAVPKRELLESIAEYQSKRGRTPVIGWLSWRALPHILEPLPSPIAQDLRQLLVHLDLATFTRLRPPTHARSHWRFSAPAAKSAIAPLKPTHASRPNKFNWKPFNPPSHFYQWSAP